MDSTSTEQEKPKSTDALTRAVRMGRLMDLYGKLLTDRQREFMQLHYGEDLSFGEIAQDYGISRQAIHDAVKHAETALEDYEAKLGFSKFQNASGNESPDLEEVLGRLRDLHRDMLNAGGIIYNAESITREIGAVIKKLESMAGGAGQE